MWGGTNRSGVPAGGTFTFEYEALGVADPDDFNTAVSKTILTDRNGNVEERFYNQLGNLVLLKELTNRDIRPGDPDSYDTVHEYNRDGQRTRTIYPEGNVTEFVYDDGNTSRFAHGNLIEVRRIPDAARGGDQDRIVTKFAYEPIYNQPFREIEARGNEAAYKPQNGGIHSPDRYTSLHIFDYQEDDNLQALADEVGVDLSELAGIFDVLGIEIDLGDLNGDGITNQIAGNPIEIRMPTVNLPADSNEAQREGDTTQEIVTHYVYNDRGQVIKTIDPVGNVIVNEYYPEYDPDGDGVPTPMFSSTAPRGYLKRYVADAELHPRRREAAALVRMTVDFGYDVVGNIVSHIDGRGIETRLDVNALNQTVQVTKAASVAAVGARGGGVEDTTEDLSGQDFRYRVQYFFDANDNVIENRIENRDGNTVEAGSAAGFIESMYTYDILDNLVTMSEEVDVDHALTWQFRYDANENKTSETKPEGNVFTWGYDERDLLAVSTRGDNDLDPFNQAPLPASTVTYGYDKNRNQSVFTDAEDHNGNGVPEDTLLFYDGFDRLIETRDAVGTQVIRTYDPASNVVVHEVRGAAGGPSPDSNRVLDNVLLQRTQTSFDELLRGFQVDVSLFTTPTVQYLHAPTLQDGPLGPDDRLVSTRTEYDRNSRPTFMVDDDLDVYLIEYDGLNRVVRSVDPEGNERHLGYDDNSNVVEVRDVDRSPEQRVAPEVFVRRSRYDALDRRVRVTDNLGHTDRFTYDSRDNLILRSDAQASPDSETLFTTQTVTLNRPGNTSHYFYDGINRLIKIERDPSR